MIYDDTLTIFNHQSLHYITFLTNPGVGRWKDLRGIVPSGTGAEKPAHRLTEPFSTYVSFDEL